MKKEEAFQLYILVFLLVLKTKDYKSVPEERMSLNLACEEVNIHLAFSFSYLECHVVSSSKADITASAISRLSTSLQHGSGIFNHFGSSLAHMSFVCGRGVLRSAKFVHHFLQLLLYLLGQSRHVVFLYWRLLFRIKNILFR